MTRKGYEGEYRAKKWLKKKYSKSCYEIVKVAIGGTFDFLVIENGKVILAMEVKETKQKAYYPDKRDKDQFRYLLVFRKVHDCNVMVRCYYRKGQGKGVQEKIYINEEINELIGEEANDRKL